MSRITYAVAAVALSAMGLSGCTTTPEAGSDGASSATSAAELTGTIAFLTPNQTVVRWTQYDQPAMETKLKELAPGLKLEVFNAQDDAAKQVQQAEAAITSGAKAIILTAADPDQTAAITAKAKDAGIPIIAYAHEANNSDPDYYVTVPFDQIGEESASALVDEMKPQEAPIRLAKIYGDPKFFFYSQQAKGHDKVLAPLVSEKKIEVVCQADSLAYSADNARAAMDQCLTKTGDKVDAVLVTNDSTANGVLAALSSNGLAGKVKVFGGYDAEPGTIQQLLAGNMSTDMRPPYAEMGAAAIEILVDELQGKKPSSSLVNGVYDNKKTSVPTAYIPNILITADNIEETLIAPKILTKKDVCAGPATTAAFCKS